MVDWVTANIPCHHDEMIFGGVITSINLDGEIEWKAEKRQQVRSSKPDNIISFVRILRPEAIAQVPDILILKKGNFRDVKPN